MPLGAAFAFGIAMNHSYTDGNKRVALIAMLTFLAIDGLEFEAPDEEVLAMMIGLASARVTAVDLAAWVRARTVPSR